MSKTEAAKQIIQAISHHYGVGYVTLMARDLDKVVRARKMTADHAYTVKKAYQACSYAVGPQKATALISALN